MFFKKASAISIEPLVQLAVSIQKSYQQWEKTSSPEEKDKIMDILNKQLSVEAFLYDVSLSDSEVEHLYEACHKVLEKSQVKTKQEVVLCSKSSTFPFFRILEKLETRMKPLELARTKKMSLTDSSYGQTKLELMHQELLTLMTEEAFLYFIEETLCTKSLTPSERKELRGAKTQTIYLSSQEKQYFLDSFQTSQRIIDYSKELQRLQLLSPALYKRQREVHALTLVNRQVEEMITKDMASCQGELLLRQQLLRASLLFFESDQVALMKRDFSKIKLAMHDTKGLRLIEEAFSTYGADKAKVEVRPVPPQLRK